MRIERNNIRMGLAGAKSNWEKNQLSQRKKFDIHTSIMAKEIHW